MKPVLLTLSLFAAGALPAAVGKAVPGPDAVKAPATPSAVVTKPASVKAPEDNLTYEIRGFFGTGDALEVSLAKKGEKTSQWIKPGQKSGDLLIETADPKAGTAILKTGGVRTTVRLAGESKPEPGAASAAAPARVKRSPEELRAMMKSLEKYGESLSDAQKKLMEEEMKSKMMDLMLEVQMSGGKPDEERVAKMMFGAMGEAMKKASALPDKNGNITPFPPEMQEILSTPLADLKAAFTPPGAKGEGAGVSVDVKVTEEEDSGENAKPTR